MGSSYLLYDQLHNLMFSHLIARSPSLLSLSVSTRNIKGEPHPYDSSPIKILVKLDDDYNDGDKKKRTLVGCLVLCSCIEEELTNCKVNYN